MWVDRNRVNVGEHILPSLHQSGAENESPSQGCIDMEPDFIFFADFSDLFYRINASLDCGPHRRIDQHADIVGLQLLLDAKLELGRNHSAAFVSFYIDDIILSDTTEMGTFFHRVVRGFGSKDFQGFVAVTLRFKGWTDGVPRSGDRHEVGEGTPRREGPLNTLPVQEFFT